MAAYENTHFFVDFGAGYVDISSDVDSVKGTPTTGLGDGKETSGEPGQLRMLLYNPDHRYTPGNLTSATALASGMQVKVTEQIGIFEFPLHTGTIEFPEINDWSKPIMDQQILVMSVDQLSRWERSQRMISTLGAQIQFGSGSSLVAYWPCTEDAEIYLDVFNAYPPLYERTGLSSTGVTPAVANTASNVVPSSAAVLADDVSVPRLDATLGLSGGLQTIAVAPDMRVTNFTTTLVSGQVATLVGWYFPQLPANPAGAILLALGTSAGDLVKITINAAGTITATATGAIAGTITATASVPNNESWLPVALRYGYNAGTFELWFNTGQQVGTLTGVPGSNILSTIYAAQAYAGGFGHVQLHIGAASEWTFADYRTQVEVATTGLERQTTGDRIRTLGAYGGQTFAQMAGVDTGTSVMARARLGGKTFADAMYEARNTEQGRLFVAGNGELTFHDRRRILNV